MIKPGLNSSDWLQSGFERLHKVNPNFRSWLSNSCNACLKPRLTGKEAKWVKCTAELTACTQLTSYLFYAIVACTPQTHALCGVSSLGGGGGGGGGARGLLTGE